MRTGAQAWLRKVRRYCVEQGWTMSSVIGISKQRR